MRLDEGMHVAPRGNRNANYPRYSNASRQIGAKKPAISPAPFHIPDMLRRES
jgi:hypothetical protein